MDVKDSKLHKLLIERIIEDEGLGGIVEFHGIGVEDSHTVLLVKVEHDIPGFLRALKEHVCLKVLNA